RDLSRCWVAFSCALYHEHERIAVSVLLVSLKVPASSRAAYEEWPLVVLAECCVYLVLNCFFFQAEDGIRDRNVTGVQTCALPISLALSTSSPPPSRRVPRTWTRSPGRAWESPSAPSPWARSSSGSDAGRCASSLPS